MQAQYREPLDLPTVQKHSSLHHSAPRAGCRIDSQVAWRSSKDTFPEDFVDESCLGPHRVNRAHWPTKENMLNFAIFLIFAVHRKNGLRLPQMGPRGFFATNPDLADILGRTDLDFENFICLIVWTPNFWISNFRNFWISRSQDFQIPRLRPGPGLGGGVLEHSAVAPRWLPDHKVGEIQGTRTIP